MVLAGTGVLLSVTPFAVEDRPGTLNQLVWHYCPVRYGLSFLSVAAFCALVTAWDLARLLRLSAARLRLVEALLCGLLLCGAFRQAAFPDGRLAIDHERTAAVALNVAIGLLAARARSEPTGRGRRRCWSPRLLVVIVTLAWGAACHELSTRWHEGFGRDYDETITAGCLAELAKTRPGPRRVCVLLPRYYPFLGSSRENVVFQPVYVPSAEWLLDYVDRNAIDVIAVRPGPPQPGFRRFLWFDECQASHSARFRLIKEEPGCAVYEVLRDPGESDTTRETRR